jgi:hypothetical protein
MLAAQQADFEALETNLKYLKEGKPIHDRFDLIRNDANEARDRFIQRVLDSTKRGPDNESGSTLLKGDYGGGKTQSLHHLSDLLAERKAGRDKILVCNVNLEHDSSVPGLHLALFQNASAITSPEVNSALRDTSRYLTSEKSGPGENTVNIVSNGLEIALDFFGIPVPGAKILAKGGLGWLKRRISRRPGHIKKLVEKLQLGDTDANELMIRWIQYSLSPNEKRWRALDDHVQRLAAQGRLFPMLSLILKASHYGTVVILIDQAEKLVGKVGLTDELMKIRDSGSAGLNLFFVFAGTPNVERLGPSTEHGGFFRRFMDPRQASTIVDTLGKPIIADVPGNDIDRIRNVLEKLKRKYIGLKVPMLDQGRVNRIRKYLKALEEDGPVTWPMLWRSMLSEELQ